MRGRMKRNPSSEDEKPTPEDSGEGSYMVKWDLTDVSPAYILIDVMVKYYYYYNNKLEKSRESREKVKGILTTMASPYGSLVLCHFWRYGATTTLELIHLFKVSKQTLNLMLLKLERFGFIRRACEVDKPKGSKSGQPSWIYVLSIADPQAVTDAQLRYNEIVKRKLREKRELKKERRRLAAEEIRRRAEAKDRLRDTKLQTLVTEFTGLYEKTKKPVSLQEIDKKAKVVGLSDYNAFLEVAIELEEKGILTWSYLNGKPDPNWEPPSKIRQVRESREEGL